jgi:hypothetical protein
MTNGLLMIFLIIFKVFYYETFDQYFRIAVISEPANDQFLLVSLPIMILFLSCDLLRRRGTPKA